MSFMSKDLILNQFGQPIVGITFSEAEANCAKLNGRLPTNKELEAARGELRLSTTLSWHFDSGNSVIERSLNFGFRCVWDDRAKIPDDIEAVEIPKPKKLLGYLAKEPIKDQFGLYLRAMTYSEAENIAEHLDAEIPSRRIYDALGDMKLESGLWCWSSEKDGPYCVLRGGGWSLDGQARLSAAGRFTLAPSHRFNVVGFRPFWSDLSKVPAGIELIKVEG
jgi:hypothetical protein